jgi:hypothetical protein
MELAALLGELQHRVAGRAKVRDPLSAARRYLAEHASATDASVLRRLVFALMWGRVKVHAADLACFTTDGALIAAALIDARLRGLYPDTEWRAAVLALIAS